MAEVAADRGTTGITPEMMVAQHVIDSRGLVWRLVHDGGMATRADYIGIVSVGIDTLEHHFGPLTNLADALAVTAP